MRTMNCDAANKLIKQLQADRDALLVNERNNSTYSFLSGEATELPEYKFAEIQEKLDKYAHDIVTLKHAVNRFNLETELPEIGLTIDAALVRMAFLSQEKFKLNRMRNAQPKSRITTGRGVSEYTMLNYDLNEVNVKFRSVCDELIAIQQALNIANLTKTFEVDIE